MNLTTGDGTGGSGVIAESNMQPISHQLIDRRQSNLEPTTPPHIYLFAPTSCHWEQQPSLAQPSPSTATWSPKS